MHTTRFETIHASVSVATTRCHSLGLGSEMNKLEQASSDYHQMLLAGVGGRYVPRGEGSGRVGMSRGGRW